MGEVTVNVEQEARAKQCCSTCGQISPGYDSHKRRWRHLDTCQYTTILVADVPRVKSKEHGVITMSVPWAKPGSGFTALFEALVIGGIPGTVYLFSEHKWDRRPRGIKYTVPRYPGMTDFD